MKTYTVAVLGATGAVGQEMIKVLQERNFPVGKLVPLASARSAGKTVKFRGEDVTIQEAADTAFKGVDIVLGAAENDIAKKFAPAIVASGAVFVDNSSAFRLNPEVPLIVPEVNPEDVKNHKGIISNPNCSTIITVTAVNALNTIAPIRTMTASTYQAVSGAGAGGPIELMNEVEALREGKTYEPKVFSHQIAFNLMENAVIHGETHHIDVTLSSEGNCAVFTVADDGRGIPQHLLPRLFDGSARSDRSSDGKRSMGIGLSVCRTIVLAHGGVIRGDNRQEGGAVFTVTLPMKGENDED